MTLRSRKTEGRDARASERIRRNQTSAVRFLFLSSLVVLASLVFAGCKPKPAATTVLTAATWEFWVDAPTRNERLLRVEATFSNSHAEWVTLPDESRGHVQTLEHFVAGRWKPLHATSEGWRVLECKSRCRIRYAIDLEALADDCADSLDCARRSGRAVLSPASIWLAHPEPVHSAHVDLRVRSGAEFFASGIRRAGEPSAYAFEADELSEGSFTAFGPVRRIEVPIDQHRIDLVILDGTLAIKDDELKNWVHTIGHAASALFGRFPVDVSVFFVPVPGARDVVFGRVFSLTGASIALLIGDEMTKDGIVNDWILAHEMIHLGFPTLHAEGHWLEEGLATYYEPILRARMGWLSEDKLWKHFREEMPRAFSHAHAAKSLEERHDIDSTYWGGALYALLADVRIRSLTGNKHSLDTALRAISASGGEVTRMWTLPQVFQVGDRATETRVLHELYESYTLRGTSPPLVELFNRLGVFSTEKGLELRSDAPDSAVRIAIAQPK